MSRKEFVRSFPCNSRVFPGSSFFLSLPNLYNTLNSNFIFEATRIDHNRIKFKPKSEFQELRTTVTKVYQFVLFGFLILPDILDRQI